MGADGLTVQKGSLPSSVLCRLGLLDWTTVIRGTWDLLDVGIFRVLGLGVWGLGFGLGLSRVCVIANCMDAKRF